MAAAARRDLAQVGGRGFLGLPARAQLERAAALLSASVRGAEGLRGQGPHSRPKAAVGHVSARSRSVPMDWRPEWLGLGSEGSDGHGL